jgi:putative nucleotidyltransferase with HDIG domain
MLAQINGIPAEEHINKTIKEIVPGLALQALKIAAEILHTGEPVKDIEFIGETLADPGLKHVWLEGWYPLKDATGKIIGFTVIVQDITKRKQADEKIKHINIKLKERVKEFNFLFQLSQLFEKTDISLEEIIQKLTGLLPAAWQYPEITCAQIILENKKYMTENFKETIWKQSGNIMINKKIIGSLEVYYSEERPEMDEGPFQKEERNLITIITERLGKFLNRIQSEMQLQQSYQKIKIAMNTTIETMSKIVEAKDPYTAGHQKRVSQLAVAISKELNLPQEQIEGIRIASLIHDVGKISVPTEILSKSIKLSDIEFSLIKEHSQTGYDILKSIDFSYPVAEIVLQHHERLNGSGYPNHLKTDKILMGARIIGVADVVEAMSSNRPYRPALGIDVALEEISKNKGILYDPIVVDTCLVLFKEKGFKFE